MQPRELLREIQKAETLAHLSTDELRQIEETVSLELNFRESEHQPLGDKNVTTQAC